MKISPSSNKLSKLLSRNTLLRRVIKNSGIILSGNVIASALNLISFTIVARELGPELLAILVLAQTYAMIVNDVFNVQTWESMIKFGSVEQVASSFASIIKTNFLLDAVSAFIAFLFAFILIRPTINLLGWDASNLRIISVYSLSILFNITTFTIGLPRLFDKFLIVAKIQVVMAVLKLLAVVCAMYFANSLVTYLYIFLIINIFTNISLITYSARLLNDKCGKQWWQEKINIDKNQIKFIWWTNLRTIIRIPVQHFDMIVINSVISTQMVGVYKVYKEIAGLIGRVGEPVNQAVFPEFTKLIGENEIKQTHEVTKKTMLMLVGVGLIFSFIMLIFSGPLVSTFFGNEYLIDIKVLYYLIALFCISFITVPINSLFIAAGFARYSFFIILFSNIVYLLSAFGLGKLIGIYGVVLAYAFQLFINKGLKIFYLKKYSSDWSGAIR